MAPKKKSINGFSVYMSDTQQELAKSGIKISMSNLPDYCKQGWAKMSNEKKEIYKARGKKIKNEVNVVKYTSIGERVDDIKNQSKVNKLESDAMYLYIEELVRVSPISYYLPKQKFILIHVNPYACEIEGFYFPAEISMAEFSLERGLIRTFHQLVGFDKVLTNAPPAPTADINNHANNNHLITTFFKYSTAYKDIYLKIVGFIIDQNVEEAMLYDSNLDLPPIYTAHCSSGYELMITTKSLNQLYLCANKDDSMDYLIRVFHLDKLFMEMKNVSFNTQNPSVTEKVIPSVAMATEYLSIDMLSTIINSIGCTFHGEREKSHLCSNFYVCKWIYVLSTHCCKYFNIKLIRGCHFDLVLTETPLEVMVEDLKVTSKNYDFAFNTKIHTQDFTAANFPALGGASSNVTQQPVWNRPLNKTDFKVSLLQKTIPKKNDDFPALSGLQKPASEKTPLTKKNDWKRNTISDKGNSERLDTNMMKLPKGRGYGTK